MAEEAVLENHPIVEEDLVLEVELKQVDLVLEVEAG